MSQAAQSDLFRYVAVRPVQTRNLTFESLRFLRHPSPAEPGTDFQKKVRDAESWAAAKSAASLFIVSPGHIGHKVESEPQLLALRNVFQLLRAALVSGNLENLPARVDAILEPAGLKPESLSRLRDRLWDNLIAAFLQPVLDGRDRRGIIDCLRALKYVEQRKRIETPRELSHVVRSTALIPKWVGKRVPPPPKPGKDPQKDPRVPQIHDLRGEVLDIDRSLDDLDVAYSAARREKRNPPQKAPAAGPAPKLEKAEIKTSGLPSGPVWTNAVVPREKLKAPTVKLLDGIDPLWTYRAQDDVAENLTSYRANLIMRLRKLAGAVATAGLDSRTLPIDREKLAGMPIDLPDVTFSADFTQSIAGSVGSVKPVGYGDLLVVKDALTGYEEGEIAYVENVMGTETKERVYRKLDRSSETTFTSGETEEITERDLQSTQRCEMQTETSETIRNDVAIDTGINISASYGPFVQVDTSADFSVDNSTEKATANASTFAQDIVDKSASKLTQRLKEQITVKVMSETEETNTHGFTNPGTDHVVGIYRWLNKTYQAQTFKYGQRLLLEMVFPEPSAFYKYSQQNAVSTDPSLQPPEPLEENFSYLDLEAVGYHKWVDRYQVAGVSPPPVKSIVVGKVIEIPPAKKAEDQDYLLTTRSDSLTVPAGYVAKEAWVAAHWLYLGPDHLVVGVGQRLLDKNDGDDYAELDDEETSVPVGVFALNILGAIVSIEIRCERTTRTLRTWQLETFQKIVDAYNSQLADYEAKVKAQVNSQASTIAGLPPDAKRAIERMEIKKGCIEVLSDQYFHDFNATVAEAAPYGYPEFNIAEAHEEAPYAQWFEQSCEWEHSTYIYYPYFWGRKDQWVANSTVKDSDPIFESFLRAGAVRVQVPVRLSYEGAMLHYLETGEIWNGGEVPTLDDPLYVSIVEEIAESQDVSLAHATPYDEPWTYTLPTTLVKLQPDATLPVWEPPA